MEDAEYGHFDAEKHRWDANFNVGGLDGFGRFDGAARGEEGDDDLGRTGLGQKAVTRPAAGGGGRRGGWTNILPK